MPNNTLFYITGNKHKFETAKVFLQSKGIKISQRELEIAEIQSDSIEEVAEDKAKKAFEIIKEPLFVSDSGWDIPALKGFPGPYMKYINQWFEPEDFINLLKNYQNREIILKQALVYVDEGQTKIFTHNSRGIILSEVMGKSGVPSDRVISLSKNGLSIADEKDKKGFSIEGEEKLWNDFSSWLKRGN